MIVSIDGPVGVGKTTVASEAARRLGLLHIDTGAIYRALAWQCLEEDLDASDPEVMADMAKRTLIDLEPSPDGPRVFCNHVDVTDEIRSPDVTALVSKVSAHPGVREVVVQIQREIGRTRSVIMEGRDIGTVVFPHADVKIYLEASLEARVRRRALELEEKGIPSSYEEVRESIIERDMEDKTRAVGPLEVAEGAVVLDTSDLDFEEVVEEVLKIIREKIRCQRQEKEY